MKKQWIICATGLAMAALIGGCSSVQTAKAGTFAGQQIAPQGQSVAHINATSAGLYLLSIPLITGDSVEPGAIVFGKDTVNVTQMTKAVTAQSSSLAASKTINLVSMTDSSNIPVPIPFLFYWRTVNVSGNAIK